MPKMKTRKSVAKRFKVTGSGKVMRRHTSRSHLMRKKNAKRRRRMALESVVPEREAAALRRAMPYAG